MPDFIGRLWEELPVLIIGGNWRRGNHQPKINYIAIILGLVLQDQEDLDCPALQILRDRDRPLWQVLGYYRSDPCGYCRRITWFDRVSSPVVFSQGTVGEPLFR